MKPEPDGTRELEEGANGRPLGSSIRRVASASALALLIGQSVSFAQTIALARILSPAEIGIFAAGTVLTMFLGTLVEGGLRSGLIQRKADLADAAETVFWVTLIAGSRVRGSAALARRVSRQLRGSWARVLARP